MKNVKITLMGTVLGTTLLLTGCGGAEAYEANAEENEVTYEQVEDDAYEVEEVVKEAKLFDRELRIGQPVDQSAFGYGQLLQVRTSANREVARDF